MWLVYLTGLSQKGDWLRPNWNKPHVTQQTWPVPVPFLRKSLSYDLQEERSLLCVGFVQRSP